MPSFACCKQKPKREKVFSFYCGFSIDPTQGRDYLAAKLQKYFHMRKYKGKEFKG
jgi:hypothetical protein